MTASPRVPDHLFHDDAPALARTLGASAPPRPETREAVAARDALANALTRAGVQLPALDVRTPWADEDQHALVHLGVCSAPVARALADVLAKGTDR